MTQQTYSRKKQKQYNMRDSTCYSVYNVETDEIVISGDVKSICERLDITKSCVSKAVKNNTTVRRRYKIYYDET